MKLYTQLPAFRKRVSVAVFLFSSQLPGGCALRARACGSADRIVALFPVGSKVGGWGAPAAATPQPFHFREGSLTS